MNISHGFFILIIIFSLLADISAICEEGQIDINTALKEGLIKIIHIADARANQIIELRAERLFESLDDLARVKGIALGGSHLADIKEQGLACVNGIPEEQEEDEETPDEVTGRDEEENSEEEEDTQKVIEVTGRTTENPERQSIEEIKPIILNPQNIKTETNSGKVSKNYAVYSFIAFSVLLVLLFLMKRKRYKNEFT